MRNVYACLTNARYAQSHDTERTTGSFGLVDLYKPKVDGRKGILRTAETTNKVISNFAYAKSDGVNHGNVSGQVHAVSSLPFGLYI
jgi:hypothetical protein